MKKNVLLTITGPSLTGKSELAKLLKPSGFEELVSTTTRPRRTGEVDGINYNFVTRENFTLLSQNKLMIQENPVGDNKYGLSRASFDKVISNGKNGIVVVAPEGTKQVYDFCIKNDILCHRVFINNDLETLIGRFLQRYKADKLANDHTYTIRLKDMMTVEQQVWVKNALDGSDKYDQIFDNFGPETQNDIILKINEAINLSTTQIMPKKLKNK